MTEFKHEFPEPLDVYENPIQQDLEPKHHSDDSREFEVYENPIQQDLESKHYSDDSRELEASEPGRPRQYIKKHKIKVNYRYILK